MMNFSFGADGALKEECRAAFPDSPWAVARLLERAIRGGQGTRIGSPMEFD